MKKVTGKLNWIPALKFIRKNNIKKKLKPVGLCHTLQMGNMVKREKTIDVFLY